MAEDNFLGGLAGNNQTQIRERKRYSDFVEEKKAELGVQFLDTISETKLYGFLDYKGYLVEPNPELLAFGDYSGEIVGLNFVVKLYNMFRDHYLRAINESQVGIPQAFQGLIVKKSYENISENYQRYQQIVSQVLMDPMSNTPVNAPVLNFNEFVSSLTEIIFDDDKKNYKITKTGYILSPYSKVYETGLYVDLAPQLDSNIDYIKAQIISDESFQCFAEIANSFGFLIDQNCPWRLALDLKSKEVQANILNYNYDRPFRDFYSSEYLIRTGLDDYFELQSFYKRMYIEYWSLKNPTTTLLRSVLDSCPEETWIRVYLTNRMRETGTLKRADFYSSDADPSSRKKIFQNILTECLNRYRILQNGLTHNSGVINYVESVIASSLEERIKKEKEENDRDYSDAGHSTEM